MSGTSHFELTGTDSDAVTALTTAHVRGRHLLAVREPPSTSVDAKVVHDVQGIVANNSFGSRINRVLSVSDSNSTHSSFLAREVEPRSAPKYQKTQRNQQRQHRDKGQDVRNGNGLSVYDGLPEAR
jgi:hypothetical protein